MNQKEERNTDIMSIVSEPDSLTFVTRKEWQVLPECSLDELKEYEIVMAFVGTGCVFMLLCNMDPLSFLSERENAFRLIKIAVNEDSKQVFSIMNLSRAEAIQLCQNKKALWE